MEPFTAIWLGAAAVFIGMIFIGFRKMDKLWKVKGLEDCGNYWDVKRVYKTSPTPEIERAYRELRKLYVRTLLIWVATIVFGALLTAWFFASQAGVSD